jgi:hypothetical protein
MQATRTKGESQNATTSAYAGINSPSHFVTVEVSDQVVVPADELEISGGEWSKRI